MDNIIYDVNLDNLKSIVKDTILNYCIDHDIKKNDIPPTIWCDILDEIREVIIEPNLKVLLLDNSTGLFKYDINKVDIIYNIYRRISNEHCQVISIKGFCDFSGIGKQTIYDWRNDSSNKMSYLHGKIMQDNEQSWVSLLQDKRVNPVKAIVALKHYHDWEKPIGVQDRNAANAIEANNLPQIALNSDSKIEQV